METRSIERIVGIDPGVTTGIAIKENGKLIFVDSMPIHEAMKLAEANNANSLFVVEDARKRRWFGNSGTEVWKGAGSIMRDCKIWDDFLTAIKASFKMKHPAKSATKLDAKTFKMRTGYTGRTNEHGRDAAMLIDGVNARNFSLQK
jgi:hypothetical protein